MSTEQCNPRPEREPVKGRGLPEILPDHLHTHITSHPALPVELHSPQTLQVSQVLPQLVSRKPLLPMTRINLPQALRDLPRSLRSLTNPDNLNIHLSSRQDPENILLRHPRLPQRKIHATSRRRRTGLRPVTPPVDKPVKHTSPRANKQSHQKPRIRQKPNNDLDLQAHSHDSTSPCAEQPSQYPPAQHGTRRPSSPPRHPASSTPSSSAHTPPHQTAQSPRPQHHHSNASQCSPHAQSEYP